jgi:hypothetical protein
MRNATCLLGALGLVTLTAGCVQDAQYPATGYSPGYATGYNTAYDPGYATGYSTAYSPSYTTGYATGYNPAYRSGYSTVYGPTYTASAPRSGRYWNSARRDHDRDGIPNRYDRDANGDGIPDRYQGRARR